MHISYVYKTWHVNCSKPMTFKFENQVACAGI